MTESEARDEICRVGASLFARGYVHGTAGNISMRLSAEQGGGFLITPTDACLGNLEPARLAHLADDGRQLGGDKASKTIALHRSIYEATDRAGHAAKCVIHTHSTHLVALTLSDAIETCDFPELIPPITPYFVMKVGHVPRIGYHRPGSPETAEQVAAAIALYADRGTPLRAVMLDRLGPNVWHNTPAQAMATLEELEETAKLLCLAATPPEPLSKVQLQELRETFCTAW